MAYQQGSLIEASDYNNLVGNFFSTSPGQLNSVFSTGAGSVGYGQSPVGNVAVSDAVLPTNWTTLISSTTSVAKHQGSVLKNVSFPYTGTSVAFISDLSTNLNNVFGNRLNTVVQGTASTSFLTVFYEWQNSLTFTSTITFANSDAARYFFNAGGQISLRCSHPNGPGRANRSWNDIADDVGNIYLSSPSTGNCKILNTTYNGVTQFDTDIRNPAQLSTNSGYYGLRASNVTIATQTSRRASNPWRDTASIQIIAKTNGTQGSTGDNGSILTIYTKWNNLPAGSDAVGAGSTTYCTIHYPSDAFIANTWGAVQVSWAESKT